MPAWVKSLADGWRSPKDSNSIDENMLQSLTEAREEHDDSYARQFSSEIADPLANPSSVPKILVRAYEEPEDRLSHDARSKGLAESNGTPRLINKINDVGSPCFGLASSESFLTGSQDVKKRMPPGPVQLVRAEHANGRWHYEVCAKGAELLESYGSRRVAIVSMCGPHNTGKSFLLNKLVEYGKRDANIFKVGAFDRLCTEGLWLWTSTESDDDCTPLLVFLDCEGFGSAQTDRQRDSQMLHLCMLLSSVLVLNTQTSLNEASFNSLAEVFRPLELTREQGPHCERPGLLWLLRDFQMELRDSNGCSITPDEYLEEALHTATLHSQGKDKHNSALLVHQCLKSFFGNHRCATLVHPMVKQGDPGALRDTPYHLLRSEFKAGVEALRMQLIAACHSSPKAVQGHQLGCLSLVTLLRQLVSTLNNRQALDLNAAWQQVQHAVCSRLTDELRTQAAQMLQEFVTQPKRDGRAQLPMPDEDLRLALRDQRHRLKAQWDLRAVGNEHVRSEYWQDLKEILAREYAKVKQQNSKLADQQLTQSMKQWLEWLDDENGALNVDENIVNSIGQLMNQMPAAPLARAGRGALEAAARRVAAARTTVAATVTQSKTAQKQAVAWGERAAQQEGAVRSELERIEADLTRMRKQTAQSQQSARVKQMEITNKGAELQDVRSRLNNASGDAHEAHSRVHGLTAHIAVAADKELSLRAELEDISNAAAKAKEEQLASERSYTSAMCVLTSDRQRLELELQDARSEIEQFSNQLSHERQLVETNQMKTRSEHDHMLEDIAKRQDNERQTLKVEHHQTCLEHMRMIEEAQDQLQMERKTHIDAMERNRRSLLETERHAGILEGQLDMLNSEASSLTSQITELQVGIRDADSRASQKQRENERLNLDIHKVQDDLERTKSELERAAQEQAQEFERKLKAAIAKKVQEKRENQKKKRHWRSPASPPSKK